MISLYESILSSTKSGSYALIDEWCKKNLRSMSNGVEEHGWMINSKNHVTNWTNGTSTNSIQIPSSYDTPVPDYIKFDGNEKGNFMIGQALNFMKPNQLPEVCEVLYISGYTKVIPSFKMKCISGLYISDYNHMLTGIEPIEIEMHATQSGNRRPMINLDNTNIHLEDLQNIHITGEVYSLYIKKTPVAQEIYKTIKKLDKKGAKEGKNLFEDYLNEIFNEKDWPGLRYIYLGERTHLEHNPKTKLWYSF